MEVVVVVIPNRNLRLKTPKTVGAVIARRMVSELGLPMVPEAAVPTKLMGERKSAGVKTINYVIMVILRMTLSKKESSQQWHLL